MEIPLLKTIEREILDPIILLLFAVAILYFIYGMYEFIKAADNEAARENGKKHVVYSVIGLFIMIGVWGIVNLICSTIGCR